MTSTSSTNPYSAEKASLLEKAAASDGPSVLEGEARPSSSPLVLPARGVFAAFVLLVVIIGWLSARYGPPAKERRPAGSVGEIVYSASRKALGGGLSGAAAGVAQVILLMWLRTTMNYQYRHGSSTCAAMRTLYAQGGVPRFYQGLPYALLQTPLSRFGDTAANTGVLALLSSIAAGGALPVALRTALASAAAALWRVAITPLDTLKTALQVEGRGAYELLLRRAKQNGACELWAGALASAAANFVPRAARRLWSPPGDCLVSHAAVDRWEATRGSSPSTRSTSCCRRRSRRDAPARLGDLLDLSARHVRDRPHRPGRGCCCAQQHSESAPPQSRTASPTPSAWSRRPDRLRRRLSRTKRPRSWCCGRTGCGGSSAAGSARACWRTSCRRPSSR